MTPGNVHACCTSSGRARNPDSCRLVRLRSNTITAQARFSHTGRRRGRVYCHMLRRFGLRFSTACRAASYSYSPTLLPLTCWIPAPEGHYNSRFCYVAKHEHFSPAPCGRLACTPASTWCTKASTSAFFAGSLTPGEHPHLPGSRMARHLASSLSPQPISRLAVVSSRLVTLSCCCSQCHRESMST